MVKGGWEVTALATVFIFVLSTLLTLLCATPITCWKSLSLLAVPDSFTVIQEGGHFHPRLRATCCLLLVHPEQLFVLLCVHVCVCVCASTCGGARGRLQPPLVSLFSSLLFYDLSHHCSVETGVCGGGCGGHNGLFMF